MSRLPGIGSHHSARVKTDEWLTPPRIVEQLGTFDLDPCTTEDNWLGIAAHYSIDDDGLDQHWHGRVWLNPPYSEVEKWMRKLRDHDHGTALVFARTETRWWFESIWSHASALLFMRGRVTFHHGDGARSRAGANSGGPSVLVAYGRRMRVTIDAREQAALDEFTHWDEAMRFAGSRRRDAMDRLQQVRHEILLEELTRPKEPTSCDS